MRRLPLPDGTELAYETAGDGGTPVLLVMGYTARRHAWRNQVGALAERHHVIWFDNRGCGDTLCRPAAWTMRHFAADALALLDHLGVERAHVAGVSMGGMIAQHLALAAPRRLRSLALIATHPGGRAAVPPLAALGLFLRANLPGRTAALERLLFTEDFLARCDRQALRRDLREELAPVPPLPALGQLAAIARHRTSPRLRALAGIPTLILRPGRDILVHPRGSDRLARAIPGARLLRFDDAGHGLIRQRRDEVNRALLEHFAAADAAGRSRQS